MYTKINFNTPSYNIFWSATRRGWKGVNAQNTDNITLQQNNWYLALASLEFSQMIYSPWIKGRSTSLIPPIFKSQSQTKMALFSQFWPSTTLLLLLGWQTKTNSNRAHHSQCSLCQTYGEESSWPIVGKMENATCQN